MPYVTPERRQDLTATAVVRCIPSEPGELNFCLTKVILEYLSFRGLRYQTINDIIGALEQAKDEFRRRVVHPYENLKLKENGDVYPPLMEEKNDYSYS